MPRRRRIHVPGGFYHITLRGNHAQPIFHHSADHALLNKIVARALEKYGARLHAYCWMSNHLHFLMQVGDAPLAGPMRQIASEFARAMQLKLTTNGHFFERRYHATLIESTDYLFTVLRYIHRNPVAAGISVTPCGYRWSSHHAYAGRRQEPWLTSAFILEKFAPDRATAIQAYSDFMAAEPDELASPFPEGAFVFGSDAFIESIRGVSREARSRQQLGELISEACRRFEVEPERLTSPVRDRYLTKVRAWIAHQAGERGVANRSEVARALGRSEGALRRAILMYPDDLG
jgi:REP element-mobilizing transposase RayT